MDVSIILISYNTRELTRNCLLSVYEKVKDIEFEVFVVDNASSDGSVEMIKQEFPQVKLIENKENKGFGAANNIAIRQSDAKYVFLLNTDTVLLNNAVKIFYDFMENTENANVAVCGGNLYNEDLTPQHSYGSFPTIKTILFKCLGLAVIFKKYYKSTLNTEGKNENNELKEVDYLTGADMFIRKSVLDEVGLFDEDFFLYFEETELTFRMKKNGYRSVIISDAKIIHLCGLSGNISLEKLKIFRKSEFLYFEKCYGKLYRNFVKFLYLIRYTLHIEFNLNYLKRIEIIFNI